MASSHQQHNAQGNRWHHGSPSSPEELQTPPWLHASAAEPGAECSPSTQSAGEAASIVCGAGNN